MSASSSAGWRGGALRHQGGVQPPGHFGAVLQGSFCQRWFSAQTLKFCKCSRVTPKAKEEQKQQQNKKNKKKKKKNRKKQKMTKKKNDNNKDKEKKEASAS